METRPGVALATATAHPSSGAATVPDSVARGGWAAQRRAVIDRALGVCVRCGTTGADTAFRSWDSSQLVAGHTRCVVGLGPPPAPTH